MISKLRNSPLFNHMTDNDIKNCLECSQSKVVSYEEDEVIFLQQDNPKKLFILIEGSVVVCNDSISGERSIITTISKTGDLFGEVFLFLDKKEYENYTMAADRAKVLEMPKKFLYHSCSRNCDYHTLLISNMLSILAQKAYQLNQKLQIMSSSTLRQKISKLLFQSMDEDGNVILKMKREELADFLNVARPSLSRELMKMQEDGLLKVKRNKIKIIDFDEVGKNL